MAARGGPTIFAYVGTYTITERGTPGKSEGIYVYRMDPSTADWTLVQVARGIVNPTYLNFDPQQCYLYSVVEVDQVEGQPGGALAAYAIDRKSGALTFLNRQSTLGGGPCYVSVDQTGRYAMAANYTGGSVAVLPIEADGRLGPASEFIQHAGKGPHPNQDGPHAHFIAPDPSNRFALVNDLGLDKVFVYRLDLTRGKLVPNQPAYGETRAGAGPRHLAFHPNGRFVYVINELDNTLTVFAWDGQRGALTHLQTISTLPEGYSDTSYCADVHVGPTGKFVYGSNRGHDSIVVFAIDEQSGKVSTVDWQTTYGEFPRNFAIDPTGQYMFVANQNTDNIVVYRLDNQSGKLLPTGQQVQVPRPVCIQFLLAG